MPTNVLEYWMLLLCNVLVLVWLVGRSGHRFRFRFRLRSFGWPHRPLRLPRQRRLPASDLVLQDSYEEQKLLVAQQQELLTEVDRLYREQSQAAMTDVVSGLPNHRAVMNRLEEVVAHCRRTQEACAVLFVDLDHFKQVNDLWGHRAGDSILHQVGRRLRANLRTEDFVGRYGGEEFAIVLCSTDMQCALQTAERLRQAIVAEPCMWLPEDTQSRVGVPAPVAISITITSSIGVAVYQLHGTTCEGLVASADQAMYQAKHAGRNCVCIATETIAPSLPVETSGEGSRNLLRSHETSVRLIHPGYLQRDTPPYSWDAIHLAPTPFMVPSLALEAGAHAQALKALMAVASAHSRDTGDHAQRLIVLVEATAKKLKQPAEELYLLRLATLLHDIGKIGIPDAILHKPGPLTAEEWAIMRSHPEIGCHILEQTGGVFHHLAAIVVAHHERWDGRGYPYGLTRNEIPISARILAVVDAYDAMTSRRCYREPISLTEARSELQRCTGSQFDPYIVAAFLDVLAECKEPKPVLSRELVRT